MAFMKIGLLVAVLAVSACAVSADKAAPLSAGSTMPEQILPVADDHSSANALDWAGTYHGVLPCADCGGIDTTLTLNDNLTYALVQRYQGTNEENKVAGTFVWDAAGQQVVLDAEGDSRQFFVGEGFVQQYYIDGTKPTGPLAQAYILKKQP